MKYVFLLVIFLGFLAGCNNTERAKHFFQNQESKEDSQDLSKFLWPKSSCTNNNNIQQECSEQNKVFVQTKDGRCGCFAEDDYPIVDKDPHQCKLAERCESIIWDRKAEWMSLYADNRLVGCGCFHTHFGKIPLINGYTKLFSAENSICKNKETTPCKKDREFVHADDGRCGCVPSTYLDNVKNCDIVGCQQFSLSASPALLYQNDKMVGCGIFETIPKDVNAYERRENKLCR